MTQAVWKLGPEERRRNNRLGNGERVNHYCLRRQLRESIFRLGRQKIVSTRPGPKAEVEAHQFVTRYTEGFSHFATSMTAPGPSGLSMAGWGLHPLKNAALPRRTPQADIQSIVRFIELPDVHGLQRHYERRAA